ncbi:MAG TPA: AAA family ATPase [Solirubrobacteraceae bacterium]
MLEAEAPTLLEREPELARLRAAAEAAVDGRGGLVVIEAAAGMGKTRLLRALGDELAGVRELRVLGARATELEEHAPFGLVRQLLDAAVLGPAGQPQEELFEGAARMALPVFGGPGAEAADRYSQLNGLFWLVASIAREDPLVLVADDVQWADDPSLELLSFLARRVATLPILLVAATRPASESGRALVRSLLLDPAAAVLRPAPLGLASVEAMVRDALGSAGAREFDAACLAATRGNPLLLGELLRDVRTRRLTPTAATAAQIGSFAPDSLSAVIDQRFAGMPASARALAEAVAVLGDGESAPLVAEVSGVRAEAIEAAEAALVAGGVLEDRGGLCFTHPLVRAAVLQRTPPSRRAALHRRAASALRRREADAVLLAGHLLHVEPAGDAEVVATLRRAAERSVVLGAPATAAAYLSRALVEPPPAARRWELLSGLGRSEARAGIGSPVEHLREAVALAPDAAGAATASLELAVALKFSGRPVEAADVLEAVDVDAGDVPRELAELIRLELLGLAYLSTAARKRLSPLLAGLRDPGGPPRTRLEAFTLAALAFNAGADGSQTAAEASELAARAMVGDLLPADPIGPGYGWLIAGVATMWADELDAAARINARMIDEGRRRGSVLARTGAAAMQSLVSWRRGRVADAEADCSLALDIEGEARGPGPLTQAARALSALAAIARGAEDGELARHEATLSDFTDADALPYHLVLHARGVVRVQRGDVDAGIADLLECGRVGRSWGALNPSPVSWRSDAAIALARAGERAQAAELAAEELELARRFGAQRAVGIAERAVALVGPEPARAAGLQEAVATLERSPARLEEARARIDLARARRLAGDRAGARTEALRAQELATACGAGALVAQAREESLAAGARPRRVALRGVDALTAAELRGARRAAAGSSNREIAEDLFVTVKTVEMHLAKCYDKLAVRSRSQLPEALGTA